MAQADQQHDSDQQQASADAAPTDSGDDARGPGDRPRLRDHGKGVPEALRVERQRGDRSFDRRPTRPEQPRRVRGGIKADSEKWPPTLGPFARGIVETIAAQASPAIIREAFEDYAARGQTRSLWFEPGKIHSTVQGRRYKAYTLEVYTPTLSHDQWQRAAEAVADQPSVAARLMAGEAAEDVLAVFARAGAALAFQGADEREITRTTDSREEGVLDKHAVCALMLTAETVERDPEVLFTLRGMPMGDFAERLRQRRAVEQSSGGLAAAFDPHPTESAEAAARPLESSLDSFWDAGSELDALELPIRPPGVSHPLLRRLGPSPFEGGKFPLVGLLATCYDVVSSSAVRGADAVLDELTEGEADGDAAEPTTRDGRRSDRSSDQAGTPASASADAQSEAPQPRPTLKSSPKAKPKAKAKAKAKARPKG
jgi:uncharacterized Zn finger protein